MTKKLSALLCALTLLIGCLGSISVAVAEEPYALTFMYLAPASAADQDKIQAAVNELTLKELNMTVTLVPVTFANWTTQVNLMLNSGEQLDVFPMIAGNAANYINTGYVVDLSDLIDQYGTNIKEQLGESRCKVSSLNGVTFGVPGMKEFANPSGFVMRTDILEALNLDVSNLKTWDDMDAIFAAVHEAYPDMVVLGGSKTNAPVYLYSSYDRLQDYFGVLEGYGQTTTVTNFYASEEYASLCAKVREWYLAGYILQDMATSTDRAESQISAGNTFCYSTSLKPNSKAEKDDQCGYDMTIAQMTTPLMETCAMTSPSYSIGYTAKDPAKCMQFLDWAYGSKDFENLINWGIEGEHWVYQDEANNIVTYPEGVDGSNVGYHNNYVWAAPNQEIASIWVGNAPDVWDQYRTFHDNATVSMAFGFMYDSTPVTNEISALTGVQEKYQYALACGSVDPTEYIPMFNQELEAAGIQRVIAEKQTQLDAWLAAK